MDMEQMDGNERIWKGKDVHGYSWMNNEGYGGAMNDIA